MDHTLDIKLHIKVHIKVLIKGARGEHRLDTKLERIIDFREGGSRLGTLKAVFCRGSGGTLPWKVFNI